MKLAWSLGIACAVGVHVATIVVVQVFFPDEEERASTQEVELIGDVDAETEKDKEKPVETKPEDVEELKTDEEPPPDAAEMMRNLELSPADSAPALEAASLGAIEAALNGQGGSAGDFADALSFSSGGRIGGTGKVGVLDQSLERAFSLAEIDQKPRPIVQGAPVYPSEMRGKKLEAVVTVIFVVDPDGKVTGASVESSSHKAFDTPALNAVRKWKFEPGLRAGQRVPCKMRIPIRFPPS